MLSAARARQLFAIHRWTGLVTGLVILFLSVTGAVLVFVTEIDRALNGELLTTDPVGAAITADAAMTADAAITADAALAAAAREYPEAVVTRVELPKEPGSVYLLFTRRVEGPDPFNQVTVDPYTGVVKGTRNQQASFAFVLRQLHLRFFYFGWKGRVVVGAFGLVLLVSCVTGLLIYGRFIRALPRWWSIRQDRGLQISTSDWHKLVGILALAFNLVIAATGAVLGLENLARFSPAVQEAIHPGPGAGVRADLPESLEDAIPVSAALGRARRAIPGFVPTAVNLPRSGGSHYAVYGNAADRIRMEGASTVHVHAITGEVLDRHDATKARAVTRAYNWMDPLHFGTWGGFWSRVLYLVFGLTTAFLAITGFMIWYLKKRRRKRQPPRRVATEAGR